MMNVNDMVTAVLGISGVDRCALLANRTEIPDQRGLPPFSVEVMWTGEADEIEVARTILEHTITGTMNYGSSTSEFEDEDGILRQVGHTRLSDIAFSARMDRLGITR